MPETDKYQELFDIQKEIALLDTISELLQWDEQTYMPPQASEYRAEQASYLAGLSHAKQTDPVIGELLSELEAGGMGGDSDRVENVNVREWRRDYDLKVKLPAELVKEISRTTIQAQQIWRDARSAKNFSLFSPILNKIIDLKRQEADCLGHSGDRYDPLLDQYEPGAITAEIENTLNDLRDELVVIIQTIKESPVRPDSSILSRSYNESKQAKLAVEIARTIGYDFNRGSLDVTAHPFCTSLGPADTRITTRYNRKLFSSAIFGVIHEAGHAIYEQNLPVEYWGSPMSQAVSLGIHESQSRLWENNAGRSRPFWEFWYPKTQKLFPSLKNVPLDDFYFAVNEVSPSFIRVEADELTYNLHILLRFELERALLSGDLETDGLPDAWNSKFKDYFGLTVPDDSQGCLQDVHWGWGLFGYFPTYTLGSMNAAQFFAKAGQEIGGQDDNFRTGNFAPLKEWLTNNIHRQGRRYPSSELTEKVTGEPLSAKYLTGYLKEKLGGLYKVRFR